MAYTDLTNIKKINGFPVDERVLTSIVQNQDEFMTIHNQDEDLESLDRDIVPDGDNMYDVGKVASRFKSIFSYLGDFSGVSLGSGNLTNLSAKLSGENTGFYFPQSGQISFVSNGLNVLDILGSGARLRAANNTQFFIENTFPAEAGTWSLGVSSEELRFGNISDGYLPKVIFSSLSADYDIPIKLISGSSQNPSLQFGETNIGGIHWDESLNEFNFSLDENSLLSLGSDELRLDASKFVCSRGSLTALGLSFGDNDTVGFFVLDNDELILRAAGVDYLELGNTDTPGVYIPGAMGLGKGNVSGPLVAAEIDVTDLSKVLIDPSGGVEIISFINPLDEQILYVIKKESAGALTVKHNDASASIKIYLRDSSDFTLSDGQFGGLVLSYDDGVWREVSRS